MPKKMMTDCRLEAAILPSRPERLANMSATTAVSTTPHREGIPNAWKMARPASSCPARAEMTPQMVAML